ncbi:MAG: sulfatase-like hydrolase/transferase [Planctomycetia bacterium]|nr:sulfatase-like hydrolase/transferase [Planctomycetia bacterium]
MKTITIVLTSVAASCAVWTASAQTASVRAAEPARRPNVIFILTDQQHAGMLSCAGNPHVKTPAMDSLAAGGARFERAYCGNPVCAPSRMSMMSGVLPSQIGMEDNTGVRLPVPPAVLANTMGQVFRRAGYETAYGGKVHTPMSVPDMGFDVLSRDEREGLADACAEFLRKKHDRPFLLVASFINPHDICYIALRDFAEKTGVRERLLDNARPELQALGEALELPAGVSREDFFARICPPLPANFEIPEGEPDSVLGADPRDFRVHARRNWNAEQWRLHRWAYARLTERVDAEIGRVLAALRETGLEDNTLVVFSSDHGDMDSAHRLEHKSVLYEEATRVPLLVSFKGVTKAGHVDREHLVSTGLDLIPTLCDFAGIPSPPELKGRSVRELAEGRQPKSWRDSLVVESGRARMLRTNRYKYVVHASGTPREQLIDLQKDPGEMKNLASDPARADVLNEHRRLLRIRYQENNETLGEQYVVP